MPSVSEAEDDILSTLAVLKDWYIRYISAACSGVSKARTELVLVVVAARSLLPLPPLICGSFFFLAAFCSLPALRDFSFRFFNPVVSAGTLQGH